MPLIMTEPDPQPTQRSPSHQLRLLLPDTPAPDEQRVPAEGRVRRWLTTAYIAAVAAAWLAAAVFLAPHLPTDDPRGLVAFAILAIAAHSFRVNLYGDSHVSTAAVGGFAIAFLYGPAATVTLIPFVTLVADSLSRSTIPLYRRAPFNMANAALSFLAAAAIFDAMAGSDGPADARLVPAALLAAAANYAVNIAVLTGIVSLTTGQSPRSIWREKFAWALPHYIVLAFLGLALAVAYRALGLAGILAFVAPPVMMHIAMRQYIAKTTETVTELKRRNSQLARANEEISEINTRLHRTYDETLEALASALDARDRETKGHSLRVTRYMMDMARQMGVPPNTPEWIAMQRGALMHDVGKIGVPDHILHKPGALSDEEWQSMRRHPRIGADILRGISFLDEAAIIVLSHHERYDGRGYPRGLRGDEIPLGARIFAVADAFDAMTSDRPYRAAMPVEKAVDEIVHNSGTQFDPAVVQAFLLVHQRWVRDLESQRRRREAA